MTTLMIIAVTLLIVGLVSGLFMFWRLPIPKSNQNALLSNDLFVSIIIPARNEEQRIQPLLHSLSLQQGIRFETIVVDDDSEDDTSRVAKTFQAHVIQNSSPTDGWIGKSAACWTGVQASRGNVLLFLDADTKFEEPDSLFRCISYFEQLGRIGILSLHPYHTIKKFYENASVIFNIIVMTGMNVFTPLGERLRSAGSFGACLICSREDYDLVGGHAAIRGAIMDDLALGEAFQEKGLPVRCFSGKGIIQCQMYAEGMHQLLEGWTKNFATASKSTHPLITSLISLWIIGGFLSPIFMVTALLSSSVVWLLSSVLLYFQYIIEIAWLSRKTGNFHLWIFPFYPALLIFFTGVFLYSFYLTHFRKTVRWRGRDVHV